MLNHGLIGLGYSFILACMDFFNLSILKNISIGVLPKQYWLLGICFMYFIQPLIFLNGLNFTGMTLLNLGWDLMSTILVTLIGVFYFKENITGTKGIGVLLAIISVILFGIDGYYNK
jgi:drug/metabolite transporter (DMT)-like permease